MLVLSRKVGQSLVIADGVTVTVSEIGLDYVRLTVTTPNEAEVRSRYPQALDVPDAGPRGDRPIVITLTLHDGALLDRLRRRMSEEESLPPSREAALSAILQTVAESDELELPQLAGPVAVVNGHGDDDVSRHAPAPPQRRRAAASGKPR